MISCGFDDTDSIHGGCTTYVAAILVEKLLDIGAVFVDYPNLIRLNPNIPYKTRGNGAVCLRLNSQSIDSESVFNIARQLIDSLYMKNSDNTNPGLCVYTNRISSELHSFSYHALTDICCIKTAKHLAETHKMRTTSWGNGRGLIGAIAAIGTPMDQIDHTYEILAFRTFEYRGTPRKVKIKSINQMNHDTYPYTFNNIDEETCTPLITPKGPDPVFYGIRGENPEIVFDAHLRIQVEEPIERWVIFRTNQGTEAHFRYESQINKLRPYKPAILKGTVITTPKTIRGGHVIFSIQDKSGNIPCAAYEPSGKLRDVVRALIIGDMIQVYGGIRPPTEKHPMTLNLEKLTIIELIPRIEYHNPICPVCNKRMKSAGKDKGYKCRCGKRIQKIAKIGKTKSRQLIEGTYYPPPRSMRHLAKPQQRLGHEKNKMLDKMIELWHSPIQ